MFKTALSSMVTSVSPRKQRGASAVEYAILVALIAAAVAVAVSLFDLGGIFTNVSTSVQSQIPAAK